ncbi:transglutaminase-like domain-containing protein [Clostridium frigidicarnis]|uniref:Transglutaminase-like superfamily protein n=1 Tax=Clostridium frigidicarnis TaxID=84698 RepID=A0A1I0ZQ11_9CLOT|nr:transglutaminase-like domain-containing protein [Clostridium frigidicarnis]SFB27879.1 Transglutaminase-like superfamily protein [Clostridium frigidicarnis]
MKACKETLLNVVLSAINLIVIITILIKVYNITDTNYWEIFFMCLTGGVIFLCLSKALSKNYNKRLSSFIFIFILVIIIFHGDITNFVKETIINKIYIIETQININKSTTYEDFRYIFAIAIPTATLLTLALIKMNLEYIIVALNFFIMMTFYYIGFKNEVFQVKYLFVLNCVILILFGKLKEIILDYKKRKFELNINYKLITFKTLIYALVVLIIIAILPIEKKGIYYEQINKYVNEKLHGKTDSEKYIIDEAYNIKQSGYSDSTKKLGGKLKISDEKIMEVYSYSGDLYLRGSVKEFYTGHSWEILNKNLTAIENNNGKIVDENKYSNYGDIIKKEEIKIVPISNNIKALVAPIYTLNVESENSVLYSIRYGTFFSKTDNRNPYTVEYYREEPIHEKIIESSKNNHRSEITSAYLDISKITKNTLDLTLDIVSNVKSNKEKVEKIVEYLNKNYKYSLDVSEVPLDKDFVDYFLFEEKEGYCVYFASALTIMCRIACVPARYVEGFKVSNTPVELGKYDVTNKDAHAWVEVLIDPNEELWTTIDCSPTPRSILPNDNQVQVTENLPNTNIENKEEVQGNSKKELKEKEDNIKIYENRNEKWSINFNVALQTTALIIILIVLIVLIGLIIRVIISFVNIKKIVKSNSATKIYVYYIKRLKVINICKQNNLTDLEFVQSLDDEELKNKLLPLVKESYKIIYGNKKISIDGHEYLKFIDDYLKLRVNVINYLLYKYILL